ncbi:MAG: CHAT domain-containing protein [Cyanobacteria bacterium P01_D01_bin.1]
MTQPNPDSIQNTFNISNSSITNASGSGSIHYSNMASAQPPENDKPYQQTILFLAANPVSTRPLRLDEEVREIESGLQRSRHRDRFTLKQRWAVRPRDMQRALLDCRPQIVHFSGHGIGQATQHLATEDTREISLDHSEPTAKVGLILEDPLGQPKLVSTESLGALFELFADSVECVLLNACYSEQQAQAIAQHIPYVIGMNQAIGDRAAIEFAVGFYDALGAGESVERAYKLGCVAIQMSNIPEHLTPLLVSQTSL